ncbi:class A beta-lactamase-related serine hydrolase [Altererythrobacter sp. KTW20L]|uniref:serine hydrolase n=1 Tax=Altererythrobacter sp. KTW20L TaxID=2942210 RepID=UPI0020C09604|nr:serine hydrolase [Altererythrobacter sp. KTW20L]MCL6249760.1 class A beta-lactamase-related serine hydrolase [Altererythrobacter sp. KTW20L]
MKTRIVTRLIAAVAALALVPATPVMANDDLGLETAFDSYFGTEVRAPVNYNPTYSTPLEQLVAQVADGRQGRIGVAAIDLSTGESVSILGDQAFPMASTSKIAIAATYLEMVDQGRASLTSEYPLLMPLRSARFSSPAAPVREGEYMTAAELIDIMITRSSNPATDAMLAAVGGVSAVNDWARRAGISNFNLTRDIATLVRDDGEFDPAVHVDLRDSSTPRAMVELLAGIYQGRWLSPASRSLMISTMERTRTGARRIRGLMPGDVTVAHKTGSLNNTSSDIGIITAPDGRSIAVAIYVTGQGTRANREARIASIARAIYDGYTARANDGRVYASAEYPVAGS